MDTKRTTNVTSERIQRTLRWLLDYDLINPSRSGCALPCVAGSFPKAGRVDEPPHSATRPAPLIE